MCAQTSERSGKIDAFDRRCALRAQGVDLRRGAPGREIVSQAYQMPRSGAPTCQDRLELETARFASLDQTLSFCRPARPRLVLRIGWRLVAFTPSISAASADFWGGCLTAWRRSAVCYSLLSISYRADKGEAPKPIRCANEQDERTKIAENIAKDQVCKIQVFRAHRTVVKREVIEETPYACPPSADAT